MADVESNDNTPANNAIKMKVEEPKDECPSKQEKTPNKVDNPEDLKICAPSNPFKSTNSNPFSLEHSKFGKNILKPSLLSVNSSAPTSSTFVLRQSSFNPFSKPANETDNKSDNSDKKLVNGEVRFVPLIKSDAKPPQAVEPISTSTTATTKATPTFVFGQNLQDRVIADVITEASPSTSSESTTNGDTSSSSDMLFSSAVKSDAKLENATKDKDTKSLTESARQYEESRANKRKYEEVQVKTGEEEETNILSISCKLFYFDKASSNWQERGRGTLRLNDFETDDNHVGSRIVFRAAGSLRVIINTKIWAEMTIDKASDKSIRLTALDSNGEVKVFLIMANIDDSRQLYTHLQLRLENEISLQKRKKLQTDKPEEEK
ncbi:ran-binding protein 3 [Anthonomus grandis grandis]|uniref:ran-binding protein 3 n=1 Tax=Anthonomus grandis grandis TaxID=2921223 RepID=UPI002165494C|nr:ran-binding protein 3 [Anthonomus grandis grandis]